MRLLIVTDAWRPQINGVVRTLGRISQELIGMGVDAVLLTPQDYKTVAMPFYPEVRLSLATPGSVARRIEAIAPDHVHIATEGPLGFLARRHCLRAGRTFTTSYHTRFPEYINARLPLIPKDWLLAALRRFHNAGAATLVATRSLADELTGRGFTKVRLWSRGVDTTLFRPDKRREIGLPRPIFLSVGRIAIEKNLPAFLDLDLPGSKLVVGDGPDLEALRGRYPAVRFLGSRVGEELAELYASADVFVFPSRTDTFGNVMLEALASGVPVAAYPVTGPLDLFEDGVGGVISEDLGAAAIAALACDRAAARQKALGLTWSACAELFMAHMRKASGKPAQPRPLALRTPRGVSASARRP